MPRVVGACVRVAARLARLACLPGRSRIMHVSTRVAWERVAGLAGAGDHNGPLCGAS